MLYIHYGKKAIVLIDEYDNPINHAFNKDTYPKIIGMLRNFYSATLKSNDHLDFAVLTEVMQVARESIFSGLNNLYVNNIFSKEYDERYGFTQAEVEDLCTYYGRADKIPEAQEWYDGYRFGEADIYNPWSLLNYVQSRFTPDTYWAGTSGNDIVETLITNTNEKNYQDLISLGDGKRILKDLDNAVVMNDIGKNQEATYTILAFAGYLNAIRSGESYELSIPNKEMYKVFFKAMVTYGVHGTVSDFREFFNAAENGDVAKMERYAFSIFAGNFQDFDLPDEGAYRRILAAAAMSRDGRYTVTSEAQSGNGRSDMIMTRNIPSVPNIVIEFKKTDSTDPDVQLKEAEEGIRQIKTKKYYFGLEGPTYLYGICFQNKMAKVVMEKINLETN